MISVQDQSCHRGRHCCEVTALMSERGNTKILHIYIFKTVNILKSDSFYAKIILKFEG